MCVGGTREYVGVCWGDEGVHRCVGGTRGKVYMHLYGHIHGSPKLRKANSLT